MPVTTFYSQIKENVSIITFLDLKMNCFLKKGRLEDMISQTTAVPSTSKDDEKDETDHSRELSDS